MNALSSAVLAFLCLVSLFVAITLAAAAAEDDDRKIVLITGCSTGIGKATALAFANAGDRFKVYATMRNPDKWDGPADDLNLIPTALDVTSDESVAACVAKVMNDNNGRPVDIVINNAGYGVAGYLESVHINVAKDVFDVNVWGAVRVLQAVLPGMRKKGGGYVINISSTSGIRGIPCFEYYTGSKFALEGIMDSLRYSLLPFNISVTNVNAGPVRTAFTDRFGKSELGGKGTRSIVDDEQNYLQDLTNRMIASLDRRMLAPEAQSSEDVAQVLVNLAKMHLEDGEHKRVVPFNFGSSADSQRVVERSEERR